MVLELPVVRVRPLPARGAVLTIEEGPDWPAAVAVLAVCFVVSVLGAAVGVAGFEQAARGMLGAGAALCVAGVAGCWLAVGEMLRRERVVVDRATVRCERRGLIPLQRWESPLAQYRGLAPVDRARRFYLRNQDRPATGRRGPVSEFAIVLRHRDDPARDVELFRAQPSLETLRAMHAMHAAAPPGSARAAQALACQGFAAGYRDALSTLCRRLGLPALVVPASGEPAAVDAAKLDEWLRPPGAVPAP